MFLEDVCREMHFDDKLKVGKLNCTGLKMLGTVDGVEILCNN